MEEKSLMVSTHSRRSIKVNMSSGSSEKDGERRRSEKERKMTSRLGRGQRVMEERKTQFKEIYRLRQKERKEHRD